MEILAAGKELSGPSDPAPRSFICWENTRLSERGAERPPWISAPCPPGKGAAHWEDKASQ